MKKLLALLILILSIFTFCSCDDNQNEMCPSCGNGLEVGDEIFEGFEVIKVNSVTTNGMYSYEIVDTKTNVVYLFTHYKHGDSHATTMTVLYKRDGSVRKHGGK